MSTHKKTSSVINITLLVFCDNMHRKTILAIAAIAASVGMMVGMATVPFSQTAAADKDCSVGQLLKEGKPPGKEWGEAVSFFAKTTGGNGDEFSAFNRDCHAD